MRSIGYSAIDLTCACLLSSILRSRGTRLTGLLRLRPLVYTGQIAYGLYLLHEPASWTARRLFGNIEAHARPFGPPSPLARVSSPPGSLLAIFPSPPFLAWKPNAFKCENENMSVYQDRKQALEQHEFRLGLERGRLAVTLDLLTDALVLVGQHGVYCQSARQPGKPAMDIQIISKCVTDAKELIMSVMAELKKSESKPA